MVQVINDPNRQTYGQTLSTSLSAALEGLVSHKVGQMQQKTAQAKTAQGLQALLGVSPEKAHSLALLDPKILEQVAKSNAASSDFDQRLGEFLGGPKQQATQQFPEQMSQQDLLKLVPEFLESEEGQKAFTPEQRQELLRRIAQPQSQAHQKQTAPLSDQEKKNEQIQKLAKFVGEPKTYADRLAFAKEIESIQSGKKTINPVEQLKIEKANKPFLDKITEYVTNVESRAKLAQQALDLVKADKVTSGLKGLVPESLLTALDENDSEFVKLTGQLANEKAVELRGPVGKAKLEAAARTKAKLSDPKEAQIRALEREIQPLKEAEAYKQAYEEILAENDDIQPSDFETKIRKRARSILKGSESTESKPTKSAEKYESSERKLFNELPKASDFSGKRIKFPDGSIRKSNGKEWVKESK